MRITQYVFFGMPPFQNALVIRKYEQGETNEDHDPRIFKNPTLWKYPITPFTKRIIAENGPVQIRKKNNFPKRTTT